MGEFQQDATERCNDCVELLRLVEEVTVGEGEAEPHRLNVLAEVVDVGTQRLFETFLHL